MVIPERKNQVAYYYRTMHRDHGYDKYVEPGREVLVKRYGNIKKRSISFGMKLLEWMETGRSSSV